MQTGMTSTIAIALDKQLVEVATLWGTHKTYSEWSSSNAIAVQKPFGGGRDSTGNATQLHHSIVPSGFPERENR